ncbi:MAG: hypothetical protein RQ751_01570 [Longimicrobiales bacterium]|nr:hypothetical protein [Longimicrobiales bacterium]
MSRDAQEGREVVERAIWRLGVLEHLFIGLAAVAALVAGLLVAWLLRQAFGLPFRPTWAVSALVLFLLPGGISYWKVRRQDRASRTAAHETRSGYDA